MREKTLYQNKLPLKELGKRPFCYNLIDFNFCCVTLVVIKRKGGFFILLNLFTAILIGLFTQNCLLWQFLRFLRRFAVMLADTRIVRTIQLLALGYLCMAENTKLTYVLYSSLIWIALFMVPGTVIVELQLNMEE